ncbi:hypothetical protein [Quatrionicoccus australiensis]|uniref:hypothetical protein n=1 Tax=Quatrionicoccus australiensis TaxID=138118 RepID=UPI001CFBB8E4|nr:hypothetical protein [Quatrionicoccus australiensis]MCB4359973.1 hypothetical protein [Quatrionicoccus australiensis]
MNPYLLAVLALLLAAIAQTSAAWIAAESFWRKGQGSGSRRSWLALTLAAGLLALHSGYTLELALRTGLYDLRQAILAALIGLLFALGIYGLRRQA